MHLPDIVARVSKRVAILGSTGSIGCNALEVIEHLGAPFRATALSGNKQIEKLVQQIKRHRPAAVCVCDESHVSHVTSLGPKVYVGACGLAEMVARDDVNIVLAAIVGAAGLKPVLAAVRAGKKIALANKESLVVAGSLLIPEARKRNIQILPVDSEHSAVFQAMTCGKLPEVRRVILTASGGPFRNTPLEQMERATLAEALNHPTWQMGSKITIDSATMFNKALEIIEACWLFDIGSEKIEVVIHPESVIHSMVEFVDGSTIAQMSPPDMRTPIQYALTYPDRAEGISRQLDITKPFALNFEPPDMKRFPALRMAYDVCRRRGTLGAVLNAANEAAVEAFIAGRVAFGMIWRVVEHTIARHSLVQEPTLEDLLEADRWARQVAKERIDSL
jgi:1-deoxy-D-xylulose-5-phosphate reductoisomerase